MRRYKNDEKKLVENWLGFSALLIFVGIIMNIWMPINKKLFSVSYSIITCGLAGAVLTFFYVLMDIVKSEGIKWAL